MARVLVVDDALMMRKTIGAFIVKAGHEVVEEAANGKQALEAYKRHNPDLVTMDITMPEVDGIDALAQIMAYDQNARVVMVSALGQQHKVFDALQNGAKGYILKPFTEEKLISIINELLGATTGTISSRYQSELTGSSDNSAKLPFRKEKQEDGIVITILQEFTPLDFGELAKDVENLILSRVNPITFNFTGSNALHSKTSVSFRQIMERVTIEEIPLRIVCYTQDYTQYFRGSSEIKKADFVLVKKRSAL